MKHLIKTIYANWLKAKSKAQRLCERAGQDDMAAKIAECKMLTGSESLSELVDVIFSPQGAEFMTTFCFPDVKLLRRFIPFYPERYGVYIDAHEIELDNVRRVCLIGDTTARLSYTKTQGNKVVLMHGAHADIVATGYSVVRVESDKYSVANVMATDHAIVSQ